MNPKGFFAALNVSQRCRELRVSLWQCPHFLFIVMGAIIALSILLTHLVARLYAEPETVVSIISLVHKIALFSLSLSPLDVTNFNSFK